MLLVDLNHYALFNKPFSIVQWRYNIPYGLPVFQNQFQKSKQNTCSTVH